MSRRDSLLHGVLIVDKPQGMTSHDVVQRLRRIARTSRVGHAGTLDPMATGVLVVMIGEGTKLGPYLTAENKRYEARVQLGRGTDTLDAEGQVTEQGPLPDWWPGARQEPLEHALDIERCRTEQIPPVYSAIKIGGESSHALARRGEALELAARPVRVASLVTVATDAEGWVDLTLDVSKGYYVRSLARDLGVSVGSPAHLTALRRAASGRFTLEHAETLAEFERTPSKLTERLLPVHDAAALALPLARLTTDGVVRARQGKRLADDDFTELPESVGASAWLDPTGALVAVGHRDGEALRILRGFF